MPSYIVAETSSNFKTDINREEKSVTLRYTLKNESQIYSFFSLVITKTMSVNDKRLPMTPITNVHMEFEEVERNMSMMRPFLLYISFIISAFNMNDSWHMNGKSLIVDLKVESSRTVVDDILRSYVNLMIDGGEDKYNRSIIVNKLACKC